MQKRVTDLKGEDLAKAYEKLKFKLAEEFKYDKVGYRKAKTEFIQAGRDKVL